MRDPLTVLISGYDSPEGPAFDRDGNLYFVNWLTSSIVRLTPDGPGRGVLQHRRHPGRARLPPRRLALRRRRGRRHPRRAAARRWAGGTSVVNATRASRSTAPTISSSTARASLYFSDPWRSSLENPVGGFYRLFPDGRLEQLDNGLAFPNGVALAPDGSAVYLAET